MLRTPDQRDVLRYTPYSTLRQRTPAWFDLRLGRITASRAAVAAGFKSCYGISRKGLFEELKTKVPEKIFENVYMKAGTMDECIIMNRFMGLVPGWPVIDWVLGCWEREGFLASPDGIMVDPKNLDHMYLIEIKRPKDLYDTVKHEHLSQMYMQMYCTGLRHTVYVVANQFQGMKIWVVEWNEDAWRYMKDRLDQFSFWLMTNEVPPARTKKGTEAAQIFKVMADKTVHGPLLPENLRSDIRSPLFYESPSTELFPEDDPARFQWVDDLVDTT